MTYIKGSSLLLGDNTVPGVALPEELKTLLPTIFKAVSDLGCEYYPTVIQMLTYDEISEIAAYGGFPVRYPHWRWGMEYEELSQGYKYGKHRIYEMVINTNPCYIYCLDSNTLVDNVTVVAHALGHNDFFKNNVYFKPTSQNMMNQLANHGSKIRKYMKRWGKEKVIEFIDHILRIENLIDPSKAWDKKVFKDPIVKDKRVYRHPKRIDVEEGHDYMEPYINEKSWMDGQKKRIEELDVADNLGIFQGVTKDIFGYLKNNAPLKPWQADIMAMIYDESMYFAPQRMTKIINEGWASYIDFEIMTKQGLVSLGQESHDMGIIDYAKHKMGVLGGKYSMNPYKLGFTLFQDIEDRWNKGKFGTEWEECKNLNERENWDKKLGLGKEKIFEVRKYYNDMTLISEFFTEEFCNENEFFEWKRYPNGEYKIENRDYRSIKKKLMSRHFNGGSPVINLADPNYKNKRYLMLEHEWNGTSLHTPYVTAVLQSLYAIWDNNVYLATKNDNGKEMVFCGLGPEVNDVLLMSREDFEGTN